jgi:NAD(P)-dependent dehydrogenase (short-subunit alcohol dehydrogenase family)
LTKQSSSDLRKRPVVWITGASRGIGYEIAKAFAEIGAQVVVTSQNTSKLASLVQQIRRKGGSATAYFCDVTSEQSVAATAKQILKRLGHVDVLVNNAGVTYFKSLRQTSRQEFDKVIATNLRGAFLCIKAVIESMVRRRSGHIINVISVAAQKTYTKSSAYSASKAGVLALTNVLREEVRPFGIKVTAVLPGATETQMWNGSTRLKYHHRMMSAEDVARIVVSVFQAPPRAHIEKIVFRPQLGDLP